LGLEGAINSQKNIRGVQRGGVHWASRVRHCVNGKRPATAAPRPNLLPGQEYGKEGMSISKWSEENRNDVSDGHVRREGNTAFRGPATVHHLTVNSLMSLSEKRKQVCS